MTAFQAELKAGVNIMDIGSQGLDSTVIDVIAAHWAGDLERKVGECSGDQRNRVMLARMLREPANLIIMDEPTNDLDLDTLRVLELGPPRP